MSLAYRTYPNNFIYSGHVYDASVGARTSYGFYWSASGRTDIYAYDMYFVTTSVGPGTNYSYKIRGRAIRCIAGV